MFAHAHTSPADPATILVASSDQFFRQQVIRDLQTDPRFVQEAVGGADALSKLENCACRVLLLDQRLPDLDSQEVADFVGSKFPSVEVVTVDSALLAGDPSPKAAAILSPHSREEADETIPGLIGSSPAMLRVFHLVRRVASRNTTVLLTGETGTGKEVIARAIHNLSSRSSRPFVTVNCAAIPEALLESELFGYTRGAFTGAVQSRVGRIHSAHGGTLFLDEIGEMPLGLQSKLLRFLESGEVQRLGSSDVFRVDVRVIGATNARLPIRIAEKQFREDLYYRLAVFPIELPPLRDRAADTLALASRFLEEFCGPGVRLGASAVRWISEQKWRGNVRELRHCMERASILWDGEKEMTASHLAS